jgi:uncharacterized protein
MRGEFVNLHGFKNAITTIEELRALVGSPTEFAQRKVVNSLDKHIRHFIELSPFLVMSTSNKNGNCDVSPRGDAPGFVMVLNEKQLVIPERPGNKRVDSMINIIENPQVGLLFFIPGLGETLRVNGKACLIQDEGLLEKMAVNGKKPLVAIGVDVEECFIHCAKAFIRSGLWNSEGWAKKETLPRAAKILADHYQIEGTTESDVEKRLQEGYKERLY